MSNEKYQHPQFVLLAQQFGMNLLASDAPALIRFAQHIVTQVTLAEREACALVCDGLDAMSRDQMVAFGSAKECAEAIRARSAT